MQLTKKEDIEKLDYRLIMPSSVASYEDSLEDAKKKIPSDYYLRQMDKYQYATGIYNVIRLKATAGMLFVVGVETVLIFCSVEADKYNFRRSFVNLCAVIWSCPLFCGIACATSYCFDPTGEKSRKKYRNQAEKEYKITFDEPSKYRKKVCCMKEKVYNDEKKHLLPHYTCCMCSPLKSSFCRRIRNYLLKCSRIKEVPIESREFQLQQHVEEYNNELQELVVGEGV